MCVRLKLSPILSINSILQNGELYERKLIKFGEHAVESQLYESIKILIFVNVAATCTLASWAVKFEKRLLHQFLDFPVRQAVVFLSCNKLFE